MAGAAYACSGFVGLAVQGLGPVRGFGFRVQGLGVWVGSGLGFRVWN